MEDSHLELVSAVLSADFSQISQHVLFRHRVKDVETLEDKSYLDIIDLSAAWMTTALCSGGEICGFFLTQEFGPNFNMNIV